jgi:hypothetical protein
MLVSQSVVCQRAPSGVVQGPAARSPAHGPPSTPPALDDEELDDEEDALTPPPVPFVDDALVAPAPPVPLPEEDVEALVLPADEETLLDVALLLPA